MADRDCQMCGACCVDQLIVIRKEDMIPPEMMDGFMMRKQGGRCVALVGQVGKQTSCSIYNRRPEICRFMAKDSWACIDMRRNLCLE